MVGRGESGQGRMVHSPCVRACYAATSFLKHSEQIRFNQICVNRIDWIKLNSIGSNKI